MKRILPILALVVWVLTSCEYHDPLPYANFSVDYQNVIPGEIVSFRNYSDDATRFVWDFGDGTSSSVANPTHYYTQEGVYRVTLAAYNGGNVDYTYLDIDVYYTTLEVVVREYYSDVLIPRVNVVVYPTYYDYANFGYVTASGVTDSYGSIIIKNMDEIEYYIDVYNDYYNNWTLAAEDLDWIRTLPLEYATHNVFTAYVDYVATSYSASEKKMRIVDIKKSTTKRSLKDKNIVDRE